MLTHFDALVLGTGGVGSAALFHLARRGLRVLGIDRFAPGHARGSSHGHTRMIRKAYFEHPGYVPMLHRAYELWEELESRVDRRLFVRTGLVEIGPPEGAVIPGVLEAARRHHLAVDELSEDDMRAEYPQFKMPAGYQAVYERDAGFLFVERAVRAHAQAAVDAGAQLLIGAAVLRWAVDENGGVTVETDHGEIFADRLVIAAGAWSSQLLRDLGIPLTVVRKPLHWFGCDEPAMRLEQDCPAFFYELPQGYYYGFPQIDRRGVKVAEHGPGPVVENPLELDRHIDDAERQRVIHFIRDYLPLVTTLPTDHTACMYTLSPDEHFIVDRHPAHENIAFAAGLSGHGFKFAPVLGEILADLVTEGRTSQPIDFLRLKRL